MLISLSRIAKWLCNLPNGKCTSLTGESQVTLKCFARNNRSNQTNLLRKFVIQTTKVIRAWAKNWKHSVYFDLQSVAYMWLGRNGVLTDGTFFAYTSMLVLKFEYSFLFPWFFSLPLGTTVSPNSLFETALKLYSGRMWFCKNFLIESMQSFFSTVTTCTFLSPLSLLTSLLLHDCHMLLYLPW